VAFAEYKGPRPDRGFGLTAIIVLAAIQLVGFFGYLGGHFERTDAGDLEWRQFVWDTETALYTAAMLIAWVVASALIFFSKEDENTKLGGGFVISLPMIMFVTLFFELVKLGPT